jgi:AcrR family transcriptional regulator
MRAHIVESAARLFVEQGYAPTTVGQIASESGVAVQTIYNAVGSKRDLMIRVLGFAAAGDRAPRTVPSFMQEQAEAEPDPRKVIELLVDFWRGGLQLTAPIFEVIRQAAALDPDIAVLETERGQARLRNYRLAGRLLAEARRPAGGPDARGSRGNHLRVGTSRELPAAGAAVGPEHRPLGGLGDRRGWWPRCCGTRSRPGRSVALPDAVEQPVPVNRGRARGESDHRRFGSKLPASGG